MESAWKIMVPRGWKYFWDTCLLVGYLWDKYVLSLGTWLHFVSLILFSIHKEMVFVKCWNLQTSDIRILSTSHRFRKYPVRDIDWTHPKKNVDGLLTSALQWGDNNRLLSAESKYQKFAYKCIFFPVCRTSPRFEKTKKKLLSPKAVFSKK